MFNLCWIAVVSPVAILLNLAALVTFIRVKDILPSTTRLLMIHQAYIEICSSSLAVVQQVTRLYPLYFAPTPLGLGLCYTYDAAYWAFDTCLQLNCILITLDRYFAICFVMKRWLTKRRVLLLIVLVQILGWLILYLEGVAILQVDAAGQCYFIDDVELTKLWGYIYVIIQTSPVICVCVFYPQMIYALAKSSKHMASMGASPSNVKTAASRRLLRTGLIAAIVLSISNMPDNVFFSIMFAIMGSNPNYLDSWQQTTDFAFKSLYPVMCPIIYSFSTAKFRAATLTAFKCNC